MANHDFDSAGVEADGDKGNADDARGALRDLDNIRARFGNRLATPWWYKVVSALVVAALFIGAGMPYESISFGSFSTGASLVVLAAVVGPVFLREILRRSTGASFDRYTNGWTVPSMALIGLLVTCVSLQVFADIDLAPLVGAAVGFVVTYLYEQWIDQRLARGDFPAFGRSA
ncbi:hypothetical protein [Ornithinimicrobium cryptoxanthini]|uniref:Uncharacterized protein n=1 Tax=Ornithinimicrobium cryptoxanthini TaxID=2934161 RepID=A0ABY4YLU2_9MICO|nr:hypothetical protein [Ornithinimicrobium cryptoxanthini]USQ77328.1 hypothetical protein NF557_05285 [Ornithinimicrobium cryptoxanthini]